jgi:hypothetical protein
VKTPVESSCLFFHQFSDIIPAVIVLHIKTMSLLHVERTDEQRDTLHNRLHLAATPRFKGIPDFKSTRIALLRAEMVEELFRIMDEIPENFGVVYS